MITLLAKDLSIGVLEFECERGSKIWDAMRSKCNVVNK